MPVEEIKRKLEDAGCVISREERLSNNTGTQLRLTNGSIVNIFDTGSISIQGRNPDQIKRILGIEVSPLAPITSGFVNKKVFVVYGHDKPARDQLEAMLRRWGLEPLIFDRLASEGQTIIEKLENLTSEVNFAVVLATPDDEGHRAAHSDEKAYRARQNVVLELGMLLAHLGRSRVAILLKQQENMERPSDIQGLIYIPFKDDLEKEAGLLLAKEMASQGYRIDISNL